MVPFDTESYICMHIKPCKRKTISLKKKKKNQEAQILEKVSLVNIEPDDSATLKTFQPYIKHEVPDIHEAVIARPF